MSIIVTGGAGFIGSCIVRTLNDMGIEDWWEWRSELDRRLCAVTGAPD